MKLPLLFKYALAQCSTTTRGTEPTANPDLLSVVNPQANTVAIKAALEPIKTRILQDLRNGDFNTIEAAIGTAVEHENGVQQFPVTDATEILLPPITTQWLQEILWYLPADAKEKQHLEIILQLFKYKTIADYFSTQRPASVPGINNGLNILIYRFIQLGDADFILELLKLLPVEKMSDVVCMVIEEHRATFNKDLSKKSAALALALLQNPLLGTQLASNNNQILRSALFNTLADVALYLLQSSPAVRESLAAGHGASYLAAICEDGHFECAVELLAFTSVRQEISQAKPEAFHNAKKYAKKTGDDALILRLMCVPAVINHCALYLAENKIYLDQFIELYKLYPHSDSELFIADADLDEVHKAVIRYLIAMEDHANIAELNNKLVKPDPAIDLRYYGITQLLQIFAACGNVTKLNTLLADQNLLIELTGIDYYNAFCLAAENKQTTTALRLLQIESLQKEDRITLEDFLTVFSNNLFILAEAILNICAAKPLNDVNGFILERIVLWNPAALEFIQQNLKEEGLIRFFGNTASRSLPQAGPSFN